MGAKVWFDAGWGGGDDSLKSSGSEFGGMEPRCGDGAF